MKYLQRSDIYHNFELSHSAFWGKCTVTYRFIRCACILCMCSVCVYGCYQLDHLYGKCGCGPRFFASPIPAISQTICECIRRINFYFVRASRKGQNGPGIERRRYLHEKKRMFYYGWSRFNFSIFLLLLLFVISPEHFSVHFPVQLHAVHSHSLRRLTRSWHSPS